MKAKAKELTLKAKDTKFVFEVTPRPRTKARKINAGSDILYQVAHQVFVAGTKYLDYWVTGCLEHVVTGCHDQLYVVSL